MRFEIGTAFSWFLWNRALSRFHFSLNLYYTYCNMFDVEDVLFCLLIWNKSEAVSCTAWFTFFLLKHGSQSPVFEAAIFAAVITKITKKEYSLFFQFTVLDWIYTVVLILAFQSWFTQWIQLISKPLLQDEVHTW